MKTITVEIEDDEILVAIKRPEDYEDVHPELLMGDAIDKAWVEWRVVYPKEGQS